MAGPDPERIDAARVVLGADRLTAHGTSCATDHATAYRLDTGPGWVTRSLEVTTLGDHGARRLELSRDEGGTWAARRWVDGREVDVDLPDLRDALDCDLGLCPLTNTMPVLRGGLLREGGGRSRLTAAWVEVPDLVVRADVQHYGPSVPSPGGGAAVEFGVEGFAATIVVDADGLVVSYPGIAERLRG
ncbi:putative glycolipid-binding domain-containing protein [Actinotalea ferrariae]|nr:putative glycolipid-binding domain-containing protein [Actinotalea ferrariae]